MKSVAVEVAAAAECDRETAFITIAPIDLSSIFTGRGPLPAVVKTTDQTGRWDTVGETRTVHLSDGSTATETLTSYEAPDSFGYTVSDATGSFRFVAREARGHWWFEDADAGETQVRWRYEFVPTSPLARPILRLIATFGWRPYMAQALNLAVEAARDG